MFKTFATAWNAHTPDYLHPYTKENLIWQLKLAAVLMVGIIVYEEVQHRMEQRRLNKIETPEQTV